MSGKGSLDVDLFIVERNSRFTHNPLRSTESHDGGAEKNMTTDKAKLTGFSLKLSPDDKKRVKLICAASNVIDYQYELFDQAVKWAVENRESLMPIANTKQGKHQSYYLCDSVEELNTLVEHWDCNHTRALYTAIVGYLKWADVASVA